VGGVKILDSRDKFYFDGNFCGQFLTNESGKQKEILFEIESRIHGPKTIFDFSGKIC
jgi:hypothetical protein